MYLNSLCSGETNNPSKDKSAAGCEIHLLCFGINLTLWAKSKDATHPSHPHCTRRLWFETIHIQSSLILLYTLSLDLRFDGRPAILHTSWTSG